MNMRSIEEKLGLALREIHSQQPMLQAQIDMHKERISALDRSSEGDFYSTTPEYWRLVIFHDALVKVRLLVEQNFRFVETLCLLATTRYIFEITIWLKLISLDLRYAILYIYKLTESTAEHNRQLLTHTLSEIELLESLASEEDAQLRQTTDDLRNAGASELEIQEARKRIAAGIDSDAARKFCFYSEDAKVNGYSLQAYIVRTELIPRQEKLLRDSIESKMEYKKRWATILASLEKRWNWKDMAAKVNSLGEYDFIYSYTSRLLHAKPASITTDQKNLELQEVYLFVRYCKAKIAEVIDITIPLTNTSLH